MFRRQLAALEYPLPTAIDIADRGQFARIVLWLEDQKIRHYKIEDRVALRRIGNTPTGDWLDAWEQAYEQFKRDLNVPAAALASANAELSWLIGYAVKLEYLDNGTASERERKIMSEFCIYL